MFHVIQLCTAEHYAQKSMNSKIINLYLQKKKRQCTYNVTMRRVRAIIVVVEKQWVLHIVCVCVCARV